MIEHRAAQNRFDDKGDHGKSEGADLERFLADPPDSHKGIPKN